MRDLRVQKFLRKLVMLGDLAELCLVKTFHRGEDGDVKKVA